MEKTRSGGVVILQVFVVCALLSCQDTGNLSEFTGAEAVYTLKSQSSHGLNGTVTFREKADRTASVTVALNKKTIEGKRFLARMYSGSVTEKNTRVMAELNPVAGATGTSSTPACRFPDGRQITYEDMLGMEACVKVLLSDTTKNGKEELLAGGDIGRLGAGVIRARRTGWGEGHCPGPGGGRGRGW